jgi:hypothetical protein
MSGSNEFNPYDAGLMAPATTGEPLRFSPVKPAGEYNPYDAGVMRGQTSSSGYPDMTPGPPDPNAPKKSVLSTSFAKLPTDTRPPSFWETMLDPGAGNVRVGTAMREAYRDTPPIVGPASRDWINRQNRLPRAMLGTAADVVDVAGKGLAAAGTGITTNISEFLSGGNPQLARDLTLGQQVVPVAQATTFGPRMTRIGGKDVPTGGEPILRKPVTTVEQADALYGPLIKTATESDFRLRPEFTQQWVEGLDKYGPQSSFEKAAQPEGTPVTQLAGRLKTAAETTSLDNIKSIQGTDRMIQTAIQDELKAGRTDNARQMRDMLQEFRDKYTDPPPNMYSGNEGGIQAFRNSIKAYAARSRMDEVQGIVDSTEGNTNRATLIASRLNAFLDKDRNVRGWSPEEKAAVRRAANAGFVSELLRSSGSRIGAIIASAASGVPIVAYPANVGTSMLLRNTADARRVAMVDQALGTLGRGVPQPGAVAPPPGPGIPPPAAMMAARYAPLLGLLGQLQANEEASR